MYELINARGDSYYIESPAKIGLVKTGEEEVKQVDLLSYEQLLDNAPVLKDILVEGIKIYG